LADKERNLAYDWIGNLLSITDGLDLHGYGYDPMSRLVSSTDYNLSYAYDRNGNRLTANSTAEFNNYSYNPANNRLAAVQGGVVKNYRYDETGNTLSDGTHNYRYDGKNQLAEITGVAFYLYNGLGQRTAKNSSGILTHYVYDEKARLIGEYNATGQANQETVYLFGQAIAVLKGADVYAVHTDHLGSPRKITNPSGNTVWQWQDKPFGDSPVNPDPDGDGVAFEYNLRFPGQYYDAETGLHYNYHRYYDPQIGRYITSDPIGLAGGTNTYTYVGNTPVNWIDPLGLETLVIFNGPTSGNPFGHTAIATTGSGVYSPGNNPNDPNRNYQGSSLTDYLAVEAARRDTTVYVLPTTPDQEKAVINYMKSKATRPEIFPDNCAARVGNSLKAGSVNLSDPFIPGISLPTGPFPSTLVRALQNLESQGGSTSIVIPRNSSIPASLNSFNPK
jgi:RHS repeat-associated protein